NDLNTQNESLADLTDAQIAKHITRIAETAIEQFENETPMDPGDRKALIRRGRREIPVALRAQQLRAKPGLKPKFAEKTFGLDLPDGLPAVDVVTPNGRTVQLRGRIDRIDLIPRAAHKLAVVFDYKSSDRNRLKLNELFHGLALQ